MPVAIQVRIDGLDKLMANIRDHPGVALRETRAALREGGHLLQADLQAYPSPPSGSTYHRTGTLGRTWTSKPFPGPSQRIGNTTLYARYVQGPQQARGHRGRWLNVTKAMEAKRQAITDLMHQALERIAAALARK